jgi:hypothetical protein
MRLLIEESKLEQKKRKESLVKRLDFSSLMTKKHPKIIEKNKAKRFCAMHYNKEGQLNKNNGMYNREE